MKITINHTTYGEIVYNESFWTGKKALSVNGTTCFAVSKKEFMVGDQKAILLGNLFMGIQLYINHETIELSPRPTWYEIVLAVLPLAFLLTWGNSPTLCAIFPVVGGAIGGAIGGICSMTSLLLMKNVKPLAKKLLVGIGMFAATLLVSFLLALLVLSMMV